MKTLTRVIQFLQYVIAAWRKSFSEQPQLDPDGAQTTAEQADREAWDAAKAEYERRQRMSDSEFWEPEQPKNDKGGN